MTNEERLELLQEMINIGFGRSSAAIADLLDVFISMRVPKICEFNLSGVNNYLVEQIGLNEKISLVRQIFRGDFWGETIIAFPDQVSSLMSKLVLNIYKDSSLQSDLAQEEVLIEISNIIIGACLGKIAELLNTTLSYNMPRVILKSSPIDHLNAQKIGNDNHILIIKNSMSIEDKSLSLYLFIIINEESLNWLYQTLDRSLDSLSF